MTFEAHKEYKNIYPLVSEKRLNGHILEYIYDKKQKHCSQVKLWDSTKKQLLSSIQMFDRGEIKTSAKSSREFRVQNGERRGGERRFHGRRGTDRSRRNAFRGLGLYVRPGRNRKCAAGIFAELEIRQIPETSSE